MFSIYMGVLLNGSAGISAPLTCLIPNESIACIMILSHHIAWHLAKRFLSETFSVNKGCNNPYSPM